MSDFIKELRADFRRTRNDPRFLQENVGVRNDSAIKLAQGAQQANLQVYYQTQQELRPLFGKAGVSHPKIGDHPDFTHLRDTVNVEHHYAVTLFMDIESSTRLGLLYEPEQVVRIKNAILLKALEIVSAFDGHVHRIMGDAILAFFNRRTLSPENACINAINAASVLSLYSKEVVVPAIMDDGFDGNFGIRVGVDYGHPQSVAWASYGYPDMDEITATGFPVDVAAKLQQAAGRNEVLVGQRIVDFLDLPDPLLRVQTRQRSGQIVREPFVQPNYTDHNGKNVDYKKWIFDWEEYLNWTAMAPFLNTAPEVNNVEVSLYSQKGNYAPCSRALPKKTAIKFEFKFKQSSAFDYKILLSRTNHGAEARIARLNGENADGEELYWEKRHVLKKNHYSFAHSDSTLYRGLHILRLQAWLNGSLVYNTKVGVYIV